MIYVFLANGFEITEAMAPVDMMRRAKLDVKTVGIGADVIESSCGVKVVADIREKDVDMNNAEAVVVPGGMPGVTNLDASDFVKNCVCEANDAGKLVCAICAGPSVSGKLGVLAGKKAVCYPGFEEYLVDCVETDEFVAADGNAITAKGAGVSVEFGLKIVERLCGEAEAQRIFKSIQCK